MPEIEDLSGRRLGEFVLRARIGEGGFGAVYRCEQPLLGREAVVKVLHPRLRHNGVVLQRFLREAQLASQLDHPGAAHIYAFGIERDDGLFWIAMELVQGVGLNRWLQEHGAMPLERFVPLFEQLAEVVHAAHERGIVHRDLKPSNVMVIERAGRLTPKLLDFGVAKLVAGAPASRTIPAPGNPGDDETVARAGGSNLVSGSLETVTQTATTPSTDGRDLRRLTHAHSTVGSPPYMSPEQWISAADVGPSSDLYALGVIAYEAITGRRPFHAANLSEYADLHCEAPVPPVGAELPPALDRFFERALAKRPEQRWRTALELAAALRAEWIATRVSATRAGREPGEAGVASDDEAAPYLGLAPYAAGDAERFVGREAEVAAFLERLRTRPLHVVVGPPGAGKSSFVHAGVLSGLPAGWRAVALRPGAAPLAALAFRLEAAGVRGDDLRAVLASAPAEAAARVAEVAGGGAVVVVIDQLEELFTLGASAEERGQFAAAVAQLAASVDLPVRVIATIRDDYLMQLDGLPALRPRLSSALILLGNPLDDDLVRVVVEPARRIGYTLSDPELAQDMVRAVASRPGALALLSFTALRLWELRDRTLRQLTRSAYEAMDGVAGALVRHAEATFEALSADDQRLAREMFRQLVTADGARAPLSVEELHQRLAAPRSAAVLDTLIAARLIAVSDAAPDAGAPRTQVEVIHDALLEAWPRLQHWIREDLDGVRMREQLRGAARQWSDRGRTRGLLWRDDVLVDLQRWLRQPRATQLSELEAEFVDASLRVGRRARVRRAAALAAAGAAAVLAVFLYSWMHSTLARQAAEQQLTKAHVDRGQAALRDGKRAEALVYLAQAARRGDDSLAVRYMFERAAEPLRSTVGRLPARAGRMWWVALSPDGRRIVTTDDAGIRIWDAGSLALLFSFPQGGVVYRAEFTPDGAKVVAAARDGVLTIRNVSSGELVRSLRRQPHDGEPPQYWDLAVSPRGTFAAALDRNGRIDVWELDTGRLVSSLDNVQVAGGEPKLTFSPDGRWLASTGGNVVRIVDTMTWNTRVELSVPQVSSLSFDPTGAMFATVSSTGDASIWTTASGLRALHLRDLGDRLELVVWSRDGNYVAAAGPYTTLVWSARGGDVRFEQRNRRERGVLLEFDPASRLIVAAAPDAGLMVADITLRRTLAVLDGPGAQVVAVRFDDDRKRVLAASWDGAVWIWNFAGQYLQWSEPEVGDDCVRTTGPEQDGQFVTISCASHGIQVWDIRKHRLLAELSRADTQLAEAIRGSEASVSSAGDRVAVGFGHEVRIHELPGGKLARKVDHAARVTAMSYAPGGHDLAIGGSDGALWLIPEGAEPELIARAGAEINIVTWLSGGRILAIDTSPQLRIYDARSRSPLAEVALPVELGYVAARVSSDGRRLLAIPDDARPEALALLDLDRRAVIARLDHHGSVVFGARFVQHGRQILTAANDGTTRLWDAETGQLQRFYRDRSTYLTDAAVNRDGTIVVTAGGDGALRFWDAASERLMWTLQAHRRLVAGIQFDGDDLITRGGAGDLARWRIPPVPPPAEFVRGIDRVLSCLPVRLDDRSGDLIDQVPRCEFP